MTVSPSRFPEARMNPSAKSVLTLSHQYGSGGSRIARDLGGRLHWSVWEKEIVRQIATQYKVSEEYVEAKDERVDSFIEPMVGLFGMGGFESAYDFWVNSASDHFSRAALQYIIAGKRDPKATTLCVLAKLLGVKPSVLLDFEP